MRQIFETPWAFLGVFLAIFFLSATFLSIIDFVPEPETDAVAIDTAPREVPTRIAIPAIGVDTLVSNPTSFSVEDLDAALLKGAVRYPGSAVLGDQGTVFLFGHQSYLPVVRNQAFKAFNDLQQLKSGDTISVYSETAEYQYRVISVEKVEAEEALIPLTAGERKLILSTCNSFGDPGERYVVTAEYVTTNTQ